MDQIKVENWNGHDIRFVWHENEWWAVAADVARALDYRDAHNMTRILDEEEQSTHKVSTSQLTRRMAIISETGIYEAIFNSQKPEAKEFKQWVKQMLKNLRQTSGLEGFQIFRMLDKEHQKEAMAKLSAGLRNPVRKDFMKANTIADKAVSNMFGLPKMLKKDQMTPNMLVVRQQVLDDTKELMIVNDKFDLGLSVSQKIYEKYH